MPAEFEISNRLAQMFYFQCQIGVQLVPSQLPFSQENTPLQRVKEHVETIFGRHLSVMGKKLALNGIEIQTLSLDNRFFGKFYSEVVAFFQLDPVCHNELLALLCVEFQDWIIKNGPIKAKWGTLIFRDGQALLIAPPKTEQLPPLPGRTPCTVSSLQDDNMIEGTDGDGFGCQGPRGVCGPLKIYEPSHDVIHALLKCAHPSQQIPSDCTFEMLQERERLARSHISGQLNCYIAILGHTFSARGITEAKMTKHQAFNEKYVKEIAKRVYLEMPLNKEKKKALKLLHDDFLYHVKHHAVFGDWGRLEVDAKNEIVLRPIEHKPLPLPKVEKREHPYKAYEGSNVWQAVRKAINDLEKNNDITLTTERSLVIGYISKILVKHKVARHSKGVKKQEKKQKKLKKQYAPAEHRADI